MSQDILNTPNLAVTVGAGSETLLETEPTRRCYQITAKDGKYIDLTERDARKVARAIMKALAIYENQG